MNETTIENKQTNKQTNQQTNKTSYHFGFQFCRGRMYLVCGAAISTNNVNVLLRISFQTLLRQTTCIYAQISKLDRKKQINDRKRFFYFIFFVFCLS